MNVYDFDKTIYNGDSSVDFYLFVLCRMPYLVVLLPFQIWGMMLYLFGIYSKEKMKEAFFVFVRYIPVSKMTSFFWKRNSKKIKNWYLQQKQDSDVVISASPEFLLDPIVCGYLGVKLIASKIDPVNVKYIGKNCYGEEKVLQFNKIYPRESIDSFYSDNKSDASLAHIAKNAFLVRGNIIKKWGYHGI